ncbi:MAG: Hsp20/alpha crystallin family protein [Spirochaetota bacterium]
MNLLMKRTPLNAVSLFNDFDRMLDSFFSDTPVWDTRIPSVDIREEKDTYILEAELPGLTEKDINVKIEDNLLTVSSQTEEKKEEKKDGYLLKERKNRSFSRSFVLPRDVDREKVDARFKNGVLTLELHKNPASLPKSIEIKVN